MPALTNTGGGQVAEDRPHISGDEGFAVMAVRVDAAAASAAAGDYIPLIVNDEGKLWVDAEVTGFAAGVIGTVAIDQTTPGTTNAVAIDDSTHGTTNLVASSGTTISQSPTVTAGAYAANDAVGGLLTFANAALVSGSGGVIKDVIILDDAGQDVEMELWLFNATFTNMADNAPWAPSEADLRKLVCVISTTNGAWHAAGTPSAAMVECSQRYDLVGTSLFGQLVTIGAPTFAATDDVTVIVGLLQD